MVVRHRNSGEPTFAKVVDTLRNTGLRQSLCGIRHLPYGARRRELLLNWLRTPDEQGYPQRIPVNCKWQLNMLDPDLRLLVKQGKLVRWRGGGGKRHPMNKSPRKRQTYLVLPEHFTT